MEVSKEFLKGFIEPIILSYLVNNDMYGFEISKGVRERSKDQFELKEATLYLTLKRMEKNHWIESYWGDESSEGGRRKYYRILPVGKERFQQKSEEWDFIKNIIDLFIGGESNGK